MNQSEQPYWVQHRNGQWVLYPPQRLPEHNVGFGSGFTPAQLASTGIISYIIVRALGASVPGAIIMGLGNVLWEAGSPSIPAGWKRYVLGLFRKPE